MQCPVLTAIMLLVSAMRYAASRYWYVPVHLPCNIGSELQYADSRYWHVLCYVQC